jgi:hypothetical protein
MYDIMYLLFSCFPAALVSYKGRENFILLLFSLTLFSAARLYRLLQYTALISESSSPS